MKVIKAVKKIAALTTAVSMIGATIMGAAAADLSQYPSPFITNGIYNGNIVVGDKAAAEDVIGAVDIQASLQASAVVPAGKVAGGAASVQGDVVEIGEPSDLLELYERIGDVRETLTDTYLDGLRGGIVSTDEGLTNYNQYLRFDDNSTGGVVGTIASGKVVFDENNDDVVGNFLNFKEGDIIFEYELEFEQGAESQIEDRQLVDLEDEEVVILGVPFTIVDATADPATLDVTLDLLGGDVLDTLEEGQTKTYTIDGKDYEVTVLIVSDSATSDPVVKFNVNGEVTDQMRAGDTDILRDETEIGVREILANEANEVSGGDIVEFYLGANKIQLKDGDYTDSTISSGEYAGTVKVSNDNINEASVSIRGTVLDANETFRLHNIKYRLSSEGIDGDIYIPPGGKLTEQLDDPRGMLTDNWDISYQGLHDTGVSLIRLDASGDDAYNLKFTNREGQDINVPLVDNSVDAGGFKYGDDDNDLVFVEGPGAATATPGTTATYYNVNEDDYFVVTDDADKTGFTHILRYESIDEDENIITFSDLGAGGQIDVPYEGSEQAGTAFGEIIVGGNAFDVFVYNSSATVFDLAVDFDNSNTVGANATAIVVVDGGGMISLGTSNTISGASFNLTLTTHKSNFDEGGPYGNTSLDEVITVNITSVTGNEVDLNVQNTNGASTEAPILRMQSISDEDVRQGLSVYGVFVEQSDSSDNNAEEAILEYPLFQRGVQVFVEIGDTVVTSGGEGGAASIVNPIQVGTAKLASEVKGRESSQNMIVVGGPCINAVAAKLMGSDEPLCGEAAGISQGTAVIKLFESGDKVALVVAGYSAEDTRRASNVLASYKSYKAQLTGMEVEVTGTSMSDIKVSAPAAQ